MSVVEGLKIQIHVCGTYVLSVWFTLLIGFGSVWIFSRVKQVTTHTALDSAKVVRCNDISRSLYESVPMSFIYESCKLPLDFFNTQYKA